MVKYYGVGEVSAKRKGDTFTTPLHSDVQNKIYQLIRKEVPSITSSIAPFLGDNYSFTVMSNVQNGLSLAYLKNIKKTVKINPFGITIFHYFFFCIIF